MRLTDLSYTNTVLPMVLATHYFTFIDAHLSPALFHRQLADYSWELFPVWACIAQYILARFMLSPSSVKHDRFHIPAIRRTILALCAISTAVWQYTIWCSGKSLLDIILPVLHVSKDGLSFEAAFAEFLNLDQVFLRSAMSSGWGFPCGTSKQPEWLLQGGLH